MEVLTPARALCRALLVSYLGLTLVAGGCESESLTLLVQLRTNYRVGLEFERVELRWRHLGEDGVAGPATMAADLAVTSETTATAGFVVAELANPPRGSLLVEVRLMRGSMVVATDERLVLFRQTSAVTLLVSRECEGVMCPLEGMSACVGGVCVDPRCTPEAVEFCPSDCSADAECVAADAPACVGGLCFAGTCVGLLDHSQCPTGTCDAVVGCDDGPVCVVDTDCPPGALACEVGLCLAETCFTQADDSLCPSGRCDEVTECEAPPCNPAGPGSSIVELSVGWSHACARTSAGTVHCWGNNESGQLGDGTLVDRPTPVMVQGLSDAVEIAASRAHTCARRATMQVVCWGSNSTGQLGDGTDISSPTPVPVAGLADAESITAGQGHTCARRSSNEVACWGRNDQGQLGDGSMDNRNAPVAVVGLTDAAQVSASSSFACARRTTGEVACWGDNRARQLGDPTLFTWDDAPTPVAVVGVSGVDNINAGQASACAQRGTGEVLCWGDFEELPGGEGTLGSGSPTPVAVAGYANATSMDGSCCHRCVLLGAGNISCLGDNRQGQCGDGTVEYAPMPVGARCVTDAVEIAAGGRSTCARRASGEVLCWGLNDQGQLGDGTMTNHLTPTAVVGLPP